MEQLRRCRADGRPGSFSDPRIGLFITQAPDLVTPKLAALLDYQLSLLTPAPPKNSFDQAAAKRGQELFRSEAGCATCHQSPNFTARRAEAACADAVRLVAGFSSRNPMNNMYYREKAQRNRHVVRPWAEELKRLVPTN